MHVFSSPIEKTNIHPYRPIFFENFHNNETEKSRISPCVNVEFENSPRILQFDRRLKRLWPSFPAWLPLSLIPFCLSSIAGYPTLEGNTQIALRTFISIWSPRLHFNCEPFRNISQLQNFICLRATEPHITEKTCYKGENLRDDHNFENFALNLDNLTSI